MFKKSKNNKMTYGIVGLGRFGTALALDLAESGSEIIAIDSNEEKVREIREEKDLSQKDLSWISAGASPTAVPEFLSVHHEHNMAHRPGRFLNIHIFHSDTQ